MSLYTKKSLLAKLLKGQISENESIELKSQWQEKHGHSISAIGNNEQGGWLIIGVNDQGKVLDKNQAWIKKQQDQAERHIDKNLEPKATVQSISLESINNRYCLFIEIINPQKAVSWNQKFYHRVGSQTVQMLPGEHKHLELKRPGLDFSKFKYNGGINPSLVIDFARFLKNSSIHWTKLSADKVLSKLSIKNKNIAGILFGDWTFRLIHYNANSEVSDQREEKGLYRLLQESCIQNIQSWTRSKPLTLRPGSLSVMEETPYPDLVLREILVNAVAHSSFERQGRGVEVRLYKNRITVSNPCSAQAVAFIKKRFSNEHFSHNPLLITVLRKAQFSDELGTGKNKVFKAMIENGKREPLFEYQPISKDYGIWSVTLYNEQPNKNFLKLLKKFKDIYPNDPDRYKISAALVLWRDKPLDEIFSYMDEYHKKLTGEILSNPSSPFLLAYDHSKHSHKKSSAKILLKRWVKVQLEGQESKAFSKAEENTFKAILQDYAYKDNRQGYVTNKEVRHLLGLSDSQSEIVQLSKMFQQWEKEKFMKRGEKRRHWKIIHRPKWNQQKLFKELFK